jgi:DNA-directed RNA polymerase specialized sigma24 family protein
MLEAGKTSAEIAKKTQRTIGAVKYRLHVIRTRSRRFFPS